MNNSPAERRERIARALLVLAPVQAEPVAWRVKDFGDGWILFNSEANARIEHRMSGALIEPLYASPPTPVSPWSKHPELGWSDTREKLRGPTEEDVARAICLSYGRDPDEMTNWLEMCDADNNPVPTWQVYVEQANAAMRLYATPVSAGLDDMGKQNGSEKL